MQDVLEVDEGVALVDRPLQVPTLSKPPLYAVILYNDDSTNPLFVVYVLINIFAKSEQDAYKLMVTAHTTGRSVVVVCNKDMAETRVQQAMNMVASEGAGQNGTSRTAPCELTFTAEKESD